MLSQILQIAIGSCGLIFQGCTAPGWQTGIVLAPAAVLRAYRSFNRGKGPDRMVPGVFVANQHSPVGRANLCRREFAPSDRCFISTRPSACYGEPCNLNSGLNGNG